MDGLDCSGSCNTCTLRTLRCHDKIMVYCVEGWIIAERVTTRRMVQWFIDFSVSYIAWLKLGGNHLTVSAKQYNILVTVSIKQREMIYTRG
jgi:hypothetical protein